MKLKNVKIFRYHLEFQPPLQMRNQTFFHRKGLLLQLQGEARVAGFGEIAPFPWVHQENLETALQQIREFKRMALSLEFPEERKALLSFFRDFFLHSSYAPSVQFGIETAFFHLCAEMQGKSMAAFLGESPSSFIRLNALLCEDQSESEIQRIQQEDYRAVKMKVGRLPLNEEIFKVQRFRARLAPQISLRLDVNRAWTLEEALRFLEAFPLATFEYLEEPLQKKEELETLFKQTAVPIALDETLLEIKKPEELPCFPHALIVKAGALGILQTLDWVSWAKTQHLPVVFSDLFFSAIGWLAQAHLAAGFGDPELPMGLDTYSRFPQNLLPVSVSHGIHILTRFSTPEPRFLYEL